MTHLVWIAVRYALATLALFGLMTVLAALPRL